MVSLRTKYRKKRMELLREIIDLCLYFFGIEKRHLELVPLVDLKHIKEKLAMHKEIIKNLEIK